VLLETGQYLARVRGTLIHPHSFNHMQHNVVRYSNGLLDFWDDS
jgi:hypothetical protein